MILLFRTQSITTSSWRYPSSCLRLCSTTYFLLPWKSDCVRGPVMTLQSGRVQFWNIITRMLWSSEKSLNLRLTIHFCPSKFTSITYSMQLFRLLSSLISVFTILADMYSGFWMLTYGIQKDELSILLADMLCFQLENSLLMLSFCQFLMKPGSFSPDFTGLSSTVYCLTGVRQLFRDSFICVINQLQSYLFLACTFWSSFFVNSS